MGKDKNAAAKRGAKKHQKEKKRAKKLEQRRIAEAAPQPSPIDAWRPEREGIEGLARRMYVPMRHAVNIATDLLLEERRPDAAICWLPLRARALSTETLLDELAQRGVTTNESAFAALAVEHGSAWGVARAAWWPSLSPAHGPHDRDMLGVTAMVLWERWLPDLLPGEQVSEMLDTTFELLNDRTDALGLLTELWGLVNPLGGLKLLIKVGEDERFLAVLDHLLMYELDDDYSEFLPALREIADQIDPDDEARTAIETALWNQAPSETERAATLDHMLAAAAEDPRYLGLAAEVLLAASYGASTSYDRVAEALREALAAPDRLPEALAAALPSRLGALETVTVAIREDEQLAQTAPAHLS